MAHHENTKKHMLKIGKPCPENHVCNTCNYKTHRLDYYESHLESDKHKILLERAGLNNKIKVTIELNSVKPTPPVMHKPKKLRLDPYVGAAIR